eukprot:356003-Chlamydomonas_euryale.AAC.3
MTGGTARPARPHSCARTARIGPHPRHRPPKSPPSPPFCLSPTPPSPHHPPAAVPFQIIATCADAPHRFKTRPLSPFAGGSLVPYALDEDKGWALSTDSIRAAVVKARNEGKHVRGLVFINPGNPTGQCLSEDNLKELIKLCYEEKIVLIGMRAGGGAVCAGASHPGGVSSKMRMIGHGDGRTRDGNQAWEAVQA